MPDQNGVIEIADFVAPDGTTMTDFSFSLVPKRFRMDPDVFEFAPELPLGLAGDMAAMADRMRSGINTDMVEQLLEMFDKFALPASAQRIRERAFSLTEPFPLRLTMPIMNWVFEKYGLHPTVPSAPSSPTSEDTDGSMPLTDGALPEESTGDDSPSTDS